MNCSRCNAEAIVKRGSAAYCARCALARDWEDVIAIVQEDRVDMSGADEAELDSSNRNVAKKKAAQAADDAKAPAAVAAESNGGSASDDLPASPFG